MNVFVVTQHCLFTLKTNNDSKISNASINIIWILLMQTIFILLQLAKDDCEVKSIMQTTSLSGRNTYHVKNLV